MYLCIWLKEYSVKFTKCHLSWRLKLITSLGTKGTIKHKQLKDSQLLFLPESSETYYSFIGDRMLWVYCPDHRTDQVKLQPYKPIFLMSLTCACTSLVQRSWTSWRKTFLVWIKLSLKLKSLHTQEASTMRHPTSLKWLSPWSAGNVQDVK